MRASTLQVYVGTYTGGDSEGIYVFDWDSETGKATSDVTLAAESENPSFLALHPSKPLLYAVNETASFDGQESGSVSAFRISPKGRHLEA
ncbi:MAG: beta-propeller fold lactonase family protein, partial [Verrucomicrobiota bacterium]|nr:beta-propeller fold lactonase family protein [Verrucomicrobiota bacterium]